MANFLPVFGSGRHGVSLLEVGMGCSMRKFVAQGCKGRGTHDRIFQTASPTIEPNVTDV